MKTKLLAVIFSAVFTIVAFSGIAGADCGCKAMTNPYKCACKQKCPCKTKADKKTSSDCGCKAMSNPDKCACKQKCPCKTKADKKTSSDCGCKAMTNHDKCTCKQKCPCKTNTLSTKENPRVIDSIMMGDVRNDMFAKLNLTNDQKKQVDEIVAKSRNQRDNVLNEKQKTEMHSITAAKQDNPEESSGKVCKYVRLDKVDPLTNEQKAAMIKIQDASLKEMRKILTPAQQKVFDNQIMSKYAKFNPNYK